MTKFRLIIFEKIKKYLSKPEKNESFEVRDGLLVLRNTYIPVRDLLAEMSIGYSVEDISDSENIPEETIRRAILDLSTIFGADITKEEPEINSLKELFKMLYAAGLDRLGPR